jgi:mRNA-degrading endonuclease RelE of RelBE toxin-antitoxin system
MRQQLMEFRIADTFTDSLTKLTGQEQKAVKTTAFDLQLNLASSGMRFHKLDRAKDPNFWSVSVNMDIRLIVHRTDTSLLLCYVDHHDPAYAWASRRRIEQHPKTGAAQLVEIRETVEEIIIQKARIIAVSAQPNPSLFALIADEELLSYGIPPEWLADVQTATEDNLFDLVEHLPQEAAEALLELATGGKPKKPIAIPSETNPFDHPDAQRRFRVMSNLEELERALEFPWEKWTVFLHPAQRALVERQYSGPFRISGSAGTGKTIVALHRAVFLARQHPQARILLTTFSETLANALQTKLHRLISNEPTVFDRIRVAAIQTIASELYTETFSSPKLATSDDVRSLLQSAAASILGHRFTASFLFGEWQEIVDAWQLRTWEAYRDVQRLGRKTRMGGAQREILWSIFAQVWQSLERQQLVTESSLFYRVTQYLAETPDRPFDFAVIDEAQDMGICELQMLAVITNIQPNSLFFTGDLGQRIFQQPFSWKALGVDIRGRSQTLTINYRTSHQIRSAADRLLPTSLTDVDGNVEDRRNTISVFNGPVPAIEICDDAEAEVKTVAQWIVDRLKAGLQPDEMGVFVRDHAQLQRAIAAITQAGATPVELNTQISSAPGCITVCTMHLAKGLEFRAVAVMACDDEVLPLQARIEAVTDESDLTDVYNTERHLLYVSCTRARDYLLISGVDPASEFLADLNH